MKYYSAALSTVIFESIPFICPSVFFSLLFVISWLKPISCAALTITSAWSKTKLNLSAKSTLCSTASGVPGSNSASLAAMMLSSFTVFCRSLSTCRVSMTVKLQWASSSVLHYYRFKLYNSMSFS